MPWRLGDATGSAVSGRSCAVSGAGGAGAVIRLWRLSKVSTVSCFTTPCDVIGPAASELAAAMAAAS